MDVSTVQEIERAIGSLTPQQLEELYVWLDQHYPQSVDTRLAADLEAGGFDSAIVGALDDEMAGRVKSL